MKEKYFLVDCDGVLLDWTTAFNQYHLKKSNSVFSDDSWDMGIKNQRRMESLINEFNTSVEFSNLEPLPHAVECLKEIYKMGYKIVVISSCLGDTITYNNRILNLNYIFGDIFNDIICIEVGGNKKPILDNYERTFWVDDNTKNCIIGSESGHDSILFSQKYNVSDSIPNTVKRLTNWKEIIKYVNKNK